APRHARRQRATADRSARAQLRADHRAGAPHHLAGFGRRVLLGVPGRFLRHELRNGRVRPQRRHPAPDDARSTTRALPGGVVMSVVAANPFIGIGHMLQHPFLRYAFLAGTAIALAAGLVGYFVVLRQQVFTGDALSHVAFTGALGALAAGIDPRVGLYGACIIVALVMAALGSRGKADDTVIGIVFAWVLG